jgi:hypothetical protein
MKDQTVRNSGVPYYSQWCSPEWVARIAEQDVDPCEDPAWQRSGFTEPDRYRFWAQRLCGLTCLESALDFWGIEHASRAVLLDDALRHDVYRLREDGGVDGLTYRPFASWAERLFGLQVEVWPEVELEEVAACITSETLAIISVSAEIRRPDKANVERGGHLILLHGRDRDGVWFHNPSGVAPYQADAYLPFATVKRFYAGRAMTLTRTA